ncbi:unnamed protein product [Durusdinium trenchii]|uniref:Aspartyl/asparaginy/proline hydroxylase domain-containing protein n=1 Tax=Durusdinium trenchii TaxID=1381693 RepID=A0ABP0RGR5_9DINO
MSADRLWAQGILEYLPEVQKNQQSTAGLDSFEASVNLDASDPQRVFFLATKLYHAGRHQEAESCYYKVLDMLPESGHGYLELVLFLESTGRREEAREVAQRAIERGALWANEWQRCPIFVSGLTSKPWWSREEFPWANELEGAFPEIKAEVEGLLSGTGMPKSWLPVGQERASQDGDIIAPGGEWREFLLYSAQDQSPATANPEVLKAFPKTCELLENLLPGAVAMAKFGVGEIILSAIAPGTKLTPHCASSNVRLTCHLGVICPEGARVRVGPTWGTWEEGRCIFFDDSYEHEVVNDADGVRIVLLIRFWHPELPSERWRDTLDAGMEDYAAMMRRRVSPPANPAVVNLRGAAASAEIHWISMGQHEHPPSDKDAPDFAVGAESDLGLLDVPDAPRLTLFCPLLRALSDKDVGTRRCAAEGLLEKAEQLIRLPQTVWHGYGQPAGVGLAAIRTASGDEVEALLMEVLQESRDWWCFRAGATLALSLSGTCHFCLLRF